MFLRSHFLSIWYNWLDYNSHEPLVALEMRPVRDANQSCGKFSILAPVLFNLYMFLLRHIIRKHSISYHLNTDDSQPYVSLSSDDDKQVDELYQRYQ